MASLVMFGLMLKNRAHAAVVYGSMLAFLVVGVVLAVHYEVQPSAATENLPVVQGLNMEGKEVRVGAISPRLEPGALRRNLVSGTTSGESLGLAMARPSTALRTEIAGMMTPSPCSKEAPIRAGWEGRSRLGGPWRNQGGYRSK